MDGGAWQAACSPWGHKESDTTERLYFHFHFQTVCKIKYLFKRKTSILRFFCLDGQQNVFKTLHQSVYRVTAFLTFAFWSKGGG